MPIEFETPSEGFYTKPDEELTLREKEYREFLVEDGESELRMQGASFPTLIKIPLYRDAGEVTCEGEPTGICRIKLGEGYFYNKDPLPKAVSFRGLAFLRRDDGYYYLQEMEHGWDLNAPIPGKANAARFQPTMP